MKSLMHFSKHNYIEACPVFGISLVWDMRVFIICFGAFWIEKIVKCKTNNSLLHFIKKSMYIMHKKCFEILLSL